MIKKLLTYGLLAIGLSLGGVQTTHASSFNVIGSLARDSQVSEGEKTQGRILVKNPGDEPVEVKAELFDYSFQADGSNDFAPPGTKERSNAHWVTLSPRQMIIPPHETLAFYYTIEVPSEASPTGGSLSGSYWSMVMLTPVEKPYEVDKKSGKVVVGVQPILRYGVQLATDITSTGTRSMNVVSKRLTSEDGTHRLNLELSNVGSLWFRPKVWAELYDASGSSVGRFPGNELRLYPGCSGKFAIDLGNLSSGKYSALVVADLGGDDIMGSQYTLEIP